jgi:hypothetical protein
MPSPARALEPQDTAFLRPWPRPPHLVHLTSPHPPHLVHLSSAIINSLIVHSICSHGSICTSIFSSINSANSMSSRRNRSRIRTAGASPEADDDFVRDSNSPALSSHPGPTRGNASNARGPSDKASRPTGDRAFTNAQLSALRRQAEAATLQNQIERATHDRELRHLVKAKAEAELAVVNHGTTSSLG